MGKRYDTILKDFKACKLDFRLNELGLKMEVKLNNQWLPLDSYTEAKVRTELRELGYGVQGKRKAPREATKEAWMTLSLDNQYNPIIDYFNQLRQRPYNVQNNNDGTPIPHTINDFAIQYFDNPDAMFPTWLFRWMVGSIAKVEKQERNPILVMGGSQDCGKSTFVRWMCPLEEYHREGDIKPDIKDERLRLADVWIQEIPELGNSTRRSDVEAFKAHITKKNIFERPPYGGGPTRMNAICSFIATVNPDGAGFLVDTTGNSRFIVCEVDHIDFDYDKTDVNQLWREAVWFYDNQFKAWELSPIEKQRRDEINASFQMVSALDDVIDTYLDVTKNNSDWMSTHQIRQHLSPHYRINSDNGFARELSRRLKMRGLKQGREKYIEGKPHRMGWFGLKPRGETVDLNG